MTESDLKHIYILGISCFIILNVFGFCGIESTPGLIFDSFLKFILSEITLLAYSFGIMFLFQTIEIKIKKRSEKIEK